MGEKCHSYQWQRRYVTPAKIVSFSIYKGGTGKTTSAVNTAAALAQAKQRVLLVDLDQQASATRYLGINPDEPKYNLYHVFYQNVPASVVRQTTSFGVDVLPSSSLMAAIEASLEPGDETLLRERLASLKTNTILSWWTRLQARPRWRSTASWPPTSCWCRRPPSG